MSNIDEEVNTIVEGCESNTVSTLEYFESEIIIPQNTKLIYSHHDLHPYKFLLYGRTGDFDNVEIINDFNAGAEKRFRGGWPINDYINNFRWIFSMPRAIITREGEIYVREIHFQPGFRYYLDRIEDVVRGCGRMLGAGEE